MFSNKSQVGPILPLAGQQDSDHESWLILGDKRSHQIPYYLSEHEILLAGFVPFWIDPLQILSAEKIFVN